MDTFSRHREGAPRELPSSRGDFLLKHLSSGWMKHDFRRTHKHANQQRVDSHCPYGNPQIVGICVADLLEKNMKKTIPTWRYFSSHSGVAAWDRRNLGGRRPGGAACAARPGFTQIRIRNQMSTREPSNSEVLESILATGESTDDFLISAKLHSTVRDQESASSCWSRTSPSRDDDGRQQPPTCTEVLNLK
ncbi:hypothetical protein EVAR_37772_1 [Eumeta japonica]|uniref:Uncharacterized protein n=1 Tax=Eumeta variegata TaxID=151549 RepID=A0A4C1WQJ4_EUMVA|nr:hypothetical protein EVAR_37772_1 [Eumeta japonica]